MGYSLLEVALQLTQWIVPLILILGILTNVLNIVILRRANLKRHSCSLYFLTLSINNLVYTSICIPYNLLADGFGIDLALYSTVSCKLISYLLNLCPIISVYMLVLTSIDRYCCSSSSVQRRRLSNIRIARWSILILLLITLLFMGGTLIVFDVYHDYNTVCTSSSASLFTQIFLTIEVILYVIIAPFLMILFGLLTINNANQFGRQNLAVYRYRPSERQLTRMLIVQVASHILLSLPFCVIFFITIIPITFKSTIMFYFLFIIFKIPFYIPFIIQFFLYILSAQIYRNEFIFLLNKIFRIRRNGIIHPMTT
jgi:hypothetical protein